MPKLRIGIVGCGAIGSSLAKAVKKNFSKEAAVVALYDLDKIKSEKLSVALAGSRRMAVGSLSQAISRSDLVIEAASSLYSWEIAKKVLSGGRDVMVMSAGGIAGHLDGLTRMARAKKSRVYIPSGAIAGVDALKAASIGKITQVTLTTRKNPRALGLRALKDDKVVFSGPAAKAVKAFPQNINVAAVLGLAGIGAGKTRVKIIASPSVTRNIHEVEIVSESGRIFSRTENIPHPANPKTSFLAVLSAIATLKQILVPVRIGT